MLQATDIDRFKNWVVEADYPSLFEALFRLIRQLSPLLENDLLILHGDYRRMEADYNTQTISRTDYDLEANRLNRSLLYLIDQLPVVGQLGTSIAKRYPSGKILHDIPRQLPLQKATKCVVRIGETAAIVLENYRPSSDAQIEDVRISEVMEVALLDASEGDCFEISSLNRSDQTIDSGDYSQWIFFVKALQTGQHPLYLKVSVVQEVNGKERKKEIVFERSVEVTSEEELLAPKRSWVDTEIRVAGSGAQPESASSSGLDEPSLEVPRETSATVESGSEDTTVRDTDDKAATYPSSEIPDPASSSPTRGGGAEDTKPSKTTPSGGYPKRGYPKPPRPPKPATQGPLSRPPLASERPSLASAKPPERTGGISSSPFSKGEIPRPSPYIEQAKKRGGFTFSGSTDRFPWTKMAGVFLLIVGAITATFQFSRSYTTVNSSSGDTSTPYEEETAVKEDSLRTLKMPDSLRLEN